MRSGFSLLEVVGASLITGLVLVGAMTALGSAIRAGVSTSQSARGLFLAQDLLDEILRTAYSDPAGGSPWGREEQGGRALFDDVDDYNDYQESPPADRNGAGLAGTSGWSRAAAVVHVQSDNLAQELPNAVDQGIKRIRVTVRFNGEIVAVLDGYKTAGSLASVPTGEQRTTESRPDVNRPPTAIAVASPLSGVGQAAVAFDARGSRDPEGMVLQYRWDFGDGQSSAAAQANHTYTNSGRETLVRTATLRVTDAAGVERTDSITITVFPAR